jgi:nucleoside-diphosphate-sugar epimerase
MEKCSVPKRCLVTGGRGLVGHRLVEMLIERGSEKVVSFDVTPVPEKTPHPGIVEVRGDITVPAEIDQICRDIDCIFHIAALVGPYHSQEAFYKVNYEGTVNILAAARAHGIKKIVMSSSPSTRFPYPNPEVNYLTEDDLCQINGGDYAPVFIQPYAETKAMGEKLIREACGSREGDLLTVAVAPHQVYGPGDALFLPSLLQTAGDGLLRVFGQGDNQISLCHVDNYCYGLILGAQALYPHSPALGKFYIITDGPPVKFWHVLDQAVVAMNFPSLFSKFHIPGWLMMSLAYLTVFVGDIYAFLTRTPKSVVNYRLKLNPFAVKMLLINRWSSPFFS